MKKMTSLRTRKMRDLVVFTAKEAAGALATIYAFRQAVPEELQEDTGVVSFGVLVETLFMSSCR